jgi:hypothetical protein
MQDPFRQRGIRSTVLTAVVNLFWWLGAASAIIGSVVGLMWAGPHAEAPAPEGPPGPGIVLGTEVTAIWLPRGLLQLARQQGGPPEFRSPEELQTVLGRSECTAAWYALTYRQYQVDGQFGEMTQARLLREAADHLVELKAVMATAAGRPPRFEGADFSHARVEVIPDTLQDIDRREAITRLIAGAFRSTRARPRGA